MFAIIDVLNNNRILWGVTMLLLNMGSRYVVADLGKFHEAILSNEYFKKIIVFSMFFVATRDVLTAFLLSILYVLLIDGILHEKRKFCIVPSQFKAQGNGKSISDAQYSEAKKLISEYEAQKAVPQKESYQNVGSETEQAYMSYVNNLNILKSGNMI